MTKPFEARFSPNPINLKPSQKTSTTLTITALDDAQLGTYALKGYKVTPQKPNKQD
jgi:hypothetical protein